MGIAELHFPALSAIPRVNHDAAFSCSRPRISDSPTYIRRHEDNVSELYVFLVVHRLPDALKFRFRRDGRLRGSSSRRHFFRRPFSRGPLLAEHRCLEWSERDEQNDQSPKTRNRAFQDPPTMCHAYPLARWALSPLRISGRMRATQRLPNPMSLTRGFCILHPRRFRCLCIVLLFL